MKFYPKMKDEKRMFEKVKDKQSASSSLFGVISSSVGTASVPFGEEAPAESKVVVHT